MGRLHSRAYIKLKRWSSGFYITSPYTWHGDVHQGAVLLPGAVWLLITLLSI